MNYLIIAPSLSLENPKFTMNTQIFFISKDVSYLSVKSILSIYAFGVSSFHVTRVICILGQDWTFM